MKFFIRSKLITIFGLSIIVLLIAISVLGKLFGLIINKCFYMVMLFWSSLFLGVFVIIRAIMLLLENQRRKKSGDELIMMIGSKSGRNLTASPTESILYMCLYLTFGFVLCGFGLLGIYFNYLCS